MEAAPKPQLKRKVLLMGKSGSGKTSMRSIIFANYLARDTARLNPTLDVHYSTVRFLGSLVLNLWDCGGQDAFFESYFESRREDVFRAVAVLIYVLDVESRDAERDLAFLASTARALAEQSPDARVVCLVHKMDLVRESALGERAAVLAQRAEAVRAVTRAAGVPDASCEVFGTSIWDETLFKAWSFVVHLLVPNVRQVELGLEAFAERCGADECVLFERNSFLVIASAARRVHGDRHRHEKVSNIIKQFKLLCGRGQGQFQGLRVGNGAFTLALDACTSNTYLLVVTGLQRDSATGSLPPPESLMLNMALAKRAFERLIAEV
jgi:Ras-related GTP-binding protein A/B